MKKSVLFIFLLLITINVSGQIIEKKQNDSLKQKSIALSRKMYWNTLPEPIGWVNDYEGLFSDNEKIKLDSLITNFERETTIEISVITIDTIKTSKDKFEDFTLHVAKTWAVGKKGKDNGILIGFSKGYKKIRIELGDGITKILSEQETKKIIDQYFIPEFKKGDYFQGMFNGITELMELLREKIKKE